MPRKASLLLGINKNPKEGNIGVKIREPKSGDWDWDWDLGMAWSWSEKVARALQWPIKLILNACKSLKQSILREELQEINPRYVSDQWQWPSKNSLTLV